jgi:hypothetical protein
MKNNLLGKIIILKDYDTISYDINELNTFRKTAHVPPIKKIIKPNTKLLVIGYVDLGNLSDHIFYARSTYMLLCFSIDSNELLMIMHSKSDKSSWLLTPIK